MPDSNTIRTSKSVNISTPATRPRSASLILGGKRSPPPPPQHRQPPLSQASTSSRSGPHVHGGHRNPPTVRRSWFPDLQEWWEVRAKDPCYSRTSSEHPESGSSQRRLSPERWESTSRRAPGKTIEGYPDMSSPRWRPHHHWCLWKETTTFWSDETETQLHVGDERSRRRRRVLRSFLTLGLWNDGGDPFRAPILFK